MPCEFDMCPEHTLQINTIVIKEKLDKPLEKKELLFNPFKFAPKVKLTQSNYQTIVSNLPPGQTADSDEEDTPSFMVDNWITEAK